VSLGPRLVAVVLALGVFATTLASAQAYRCGTDEDTHERCCCPEDRAPADAPSLDASCCCELITGSAPEADRAIAVTATPELPAIAAMPIIIVEPPPAAELAVAPAPRGGAPPPPLLYARNCSLLL
jgi:hypothetical protein